MDEPYFLEIIGPIEPLITLVRNTVTSVCSSQCRYFAVTSKECYAPGLWTTVTCVDGQMCSNFHGTVQCHWQMLHLAVTLHSNFLHHVIL